MDALGQNGILLASQTGSGKTLAYLLPIVHQLKRFEEVEGRARSKRPRCIVVAPTQELVEQIFKVVICFFHPEELIDRIKPCLLKKLVEGSTYSKFIIESFLHK